jgi:hypothetical protein
MGNKPNATLETSQGKRSFRSRSIETHRPDVISTRALAPLPCPSLTTASNSCRSRPVHFATVKAWMAGGVVHRPSKKTRSFWLLPPLVFLLQGCNLRFVSSDRDRESSRDKLKADDGCKTSSPATAWSTQLARACDPHFRLALSLLTRR